MSQPNPSSSPYAHVSPTAAVRGASHNYILSFALLVLAATIFFFSTVTKSSASSEPPLCAIYAKKQVGECFEFGRYPQGPNGEIKPITWRVLQRKKDHLLAISEKCLDCKQYNKQFCVVTWANCTLRYWLNSEFYDNAFNDQERECILQTSNVNNAGPKTEDYVFLLSVDEARSVFANDEVRLAKPTEYAIKNGVRIDDNSNGYCHWWLRSRGNHDNDAADVGTNSGVIEPGLQVHYDDHAVRPALKLAL